MVAEWTPDRAIEEAEDDSVTRKKLLGTKGSKIRRPFQKFGIFRGWVHETPFFAYLTENEVPHYLYATSSSVAKEVGTETITYTPEKVYRTLFGFTDDRVIALVGQTPKNKLFSAWYHDVESFSISPQEETIKFPIEDRTNGSLPNKPGMPEAKAEFAFDTIASRLRFTPSFRFSISEILDNISPFLETKTEMSEWKGKTGWEQLQKEYDRKLREYEQWQQELKHLVERAKGDLTATKVRNIWDHLKQGEQPHYMFSGQEHHIKIRSSNTRSVAETKQYEQIIFTDKRILIEGPDLWEISYDTVTDYGIEETTISYEEANTTQVEDAHILTIMTPDHVHQLDIERLPIKEISNLTTYLRTHGNRDTTT